MKTVNAYITGGIHKKNAILKESWHTHKCGFISRVNLEDGNIERVLSYESPITACPSKDPSILFLSSFYKDKLLYTCTKTEVLIYDVRNFELVRYISLPCFNDVHHVFPKPNGHLLVAITGLDRVVEIDEKDEIVRVWSTCGELSNERFSERIDYRKVLTTQPHKSHPNHIFSLNEDVWVTRFEQKDAINISKPGERIAIDIAKPHDGLVWKDWVVFTVIDGHILFVDKFSLKVVRTVNLNQLYLDSDYSLGWCRGIAMLDTDYILVGFTRLRPTILHENIGWVRHKLGVKKSIGDMPTRIAKVDIKNMKICWETSLEMDGLGATLHGIQVF